MAIYYIHQDRQRCIGCHACEVHCKSKNNLPVGPRFCRISQEGPELIGGIPKIDFIFSTCFHCQDPPCMAVCPSGAMQKRAGDGIVFVEQELCIGCQACIDACPYQAPQWDEAKGKASKCDYCMERVDRGLLPACVSKCTAHALHWLTGEEAVLARKKDRG